MYEEGGNIPCMLGGDMPSYEKWWEYQTEWGGELEAVSHNPYSEGSGITIWLMVIQHMMSLMVLVEQV
jgi:hypothetical protein